MNYSVNYIERCMKIKSHEVMKRQKATTLRKINFFIKKSTIIFLLKTVVRIAVCDNFITMIEITLYNMVITFKLFAYIIYLECKFI